MVFCLLLLSRKNFSIGKNIPSSYSKNADKVCCEGDRLMSILEFGSVPVQTIMQSQCPFIS